jgi:hypothetical protein
VGGDMPVMSMVDNIYMHIRSLKRETQQVLHDCYVAQEKVFNGVRVTRSLVLYLCFVDRCLSFCTFSFCHYFVCSSSQQIYFELWLAIWALIGTKVTWVWWCGFNFRRPSCKAKNNWLLLMFKHWFCWKYQYNTYIFNMIDNYSFIPVAVCGVGSYRGPSPLLFSGPSMLLRRPCICPTSFAPSNWNKSYLGLVVWFQF